MTGPLPPLLWLAPLKRCSSGSLDRACSEGWYLRMTSFHSQKLRDQEPDSKQPCHSQLLSLWLAPDLPSLASIPCNKGLEFLLFLCFPKWLASKSSEKPGEWIFFSAFLREWGGGGGIGFRCCCYCCCCCFVGFFLTHWVFLCSPGWPQAHLSPCRPQNSWSSCLPLPGLQVCLTLTNTFVSCALAKLWLSYPTQCGWEVYLHWRITAHSSDKNYLTW